MKKQAIVIIGFLLLIIYFVAMHNKPSFLLIKTSAGKTLEIEVEIVSTEEEMELGLMGREELEDGRGMLFVYDGKQQPLIWMRNMKISLDIVFVGSDLRINHIKQNAEPCLTESPHQCERYRSDKSSLYVLEVPAGYTDRQGIGLGDEIVLPSGL